VTAGNLFLSLISCFFSDARRAPLQGETKNPTAVWQWGSINFVTQSEPDRRAAQPPRIQQQVQIQITIHDGKVTITSGHVKWFLICVFRESVGVCRRRASGNITVRKVMLDEDSRAH
jgi:hypothetical protein